MPAVVCSFAVLRRTWRVTRGLCFVTAALAVSARAADAPTKAPAVQFESHVLPILKARCFKCHAGAEPKGELSLTSPASLLRGGQSGPAIRIAAAESSLLWERIVTNAMPVGGPPLSAEEKGILRTWINAGAIAEEIGKEPHSEKPDSETVDSSAREAGSHWAFRPPVRLSPPVVAQPLAALPPGSPPLRNAIDAFVAAKLQEHQLGLSPTADRSTLLRRVTFDLIGLPPSPEEVDSFLADSDPLAYERLIDRLLASPQYGERWGRHWLDVAGYADSAGVLAEDRPLPTAFRFRDYVIRAFNADKPYDRFLQEQFAGDELSQYWRVHDTADRLSDEVIDAVIATGFLRCAADSSRPDFSTIKNADALYFYPTLNDTLQIVASATLGLSLQCARCHSHKYDPIPQVEYYRLQAIFTPALRPSQWVPQMERRIEVATASEKKAAAERNAQIDAETARLKQELTQLRTEYQERLLASRLETLPAPIREDAKRAVATPADKRSPVESYLADKFQSLLAPDSKTLDTLLPATFADYRAGLEQRNTAIAAQERQRVAFAEIRALYDLPGEPVTPLLRRGDPLTPGAPVEPGVPAALATPVAFEWKRPEAGAKTSGRRLSFAQWLTQPEHPLTSRVFVNRVWLHHFGEGLVATPEDFGHSGTRPSHPELLDWLAREFVESGWSVKHLHRLILMSATYQQRSSLSAETAVRTQEVDPDNRLLGRQRLRRLEAEPVRDALLAVTGQLDSHQFGPAIPVARRPDGEVNIADGANPRRRSVYLQVLRANPPTLLQAFDQPVMETNCVRRGQSTVATQALTFLNSEALVSAADAFATRLSREAPDDPVGAAVKLAFSRSATEEERAALIDFLTTQSARYEALGEAAPTPRHRALADMCHMLLAANEFVYID